jgi:hypothetical protein
MARPPFPQLISLAEMLVLAQGAVNPADLPSPSARKQGSLFSTDG